MSHSVLVVDDDPEIHNLVGALLKGSNWQTEFASGAEEALRTLESRQYHVVLADILMPEMDGLTMLSRILEIRPETKVLMMTAQNRADRVADSLHRQAAGYIVKPFSKDQLLTALGTALAWRKDEDDIEVLSATPNWISVRAGCTLEIAGRLSRFFREMLSGLDSTQREEVSYAFTELLTNAIEHGGKLDRKQKVELHYVRTQRAIIYYIRDPGEGFKMNQIPHAAISHPGDTLEHLHVREEMGIRPGGFGMLLTKQFADELIYNSKGNEVIFIKRIV